MENNNYIFKSRARSKSLVVYGRYLLICTEYPEDEDVHVSDELHPYNLSGKVKFTCVGFSMNTLKSSILDYQIYPSELTLSQYIKSLDLERLASEIWSEEVYDGYDMPEIPYTDD